MDTKSKVKYVTYLVGVIALVSLVHVVPVRVGVLVVCALTNVLYVNKK